jgi:hypothetical protein
LRARREIGFKGPFFLYHPRLFDAQQGFVGRDAWVGEGDFSSGWVAGLKSHHFSFLPSVPAMCSLMRRVYKKGRDMLGQD